MKQPRFLPVIVACMLFAGAPGFAKDNASDNDSRPLRHEVGLGAPFGFYTDYYSYTSIKFGPLVDYSFTPLYVPLKKRRAMALRLGAATGALFEGAQKFNQDFYFRALPAMIPLTASLLFEFFPIHWFALGLEINAGPNLLVHKGDNPNLLYTFTPALAFRFCLPKAFSIKLWAGYGTMGVHRDFWWGPGFYLGAAKQFNRRR